MPWLASSARANSPAIAEAPSPDAPPLSEDGSGLLFLLGRQPLPQLVRVGPESSAAGVTAEECLRCSVLKSSSKLAEERGPVIAEHAECYRLHDAVGASLFAQDLV